MRSSLRRSWNEFAAQESCTLFQTGKAKQVPANVLSAYRARAKRGHLRLGCARLNQIFSRQTRGEGSLVKLSADKEVREPSRNSEVGFTLQQTLQAALIAEALAESFEAGFAHAIHLSHI